MLKKLLITYINRTFVSNFKTVINKIKQVQLRIK